MKIGTAYVVEDGSFQIGDWIEYECDEGLFSFRNSSAFFKCTETGWNKTHLTECYDGNSYEMILNKVLYSNFVLL